MVLHVRVVLSLTVKVHASIGQTVSLRVRMYHLILLLLFSLLQRLHHYCATATLLCCCSNIQ
jgi:hypothetical protein